MTQPAEQRAEPTPLPWEISEHSGGDGHEIDIQKPNGGGWFLRLSPGYAFDEFPEPEEVRAEFEANVRLIIEDVNAAPDTAAERDKLQAAFNRLTDWMAPKGWSHCTTERELMEQVDRIEAERDRLQAANEHWHLRITQMKTDAEAAEARVAEQENINIDAYDKFQLAAQRAIDWEAKADQALELARATREYFKRIIQAIDRTTTSGEIRREHDEVKRLANEALDALTPEEGS